MTRSIASLMPFSELMGIDVTEATAEVVRASLLVKDDLCTTGGIMHGGAIMAFADTLGAIGAFLNVPDGSNGTTTIESTTKFLGGAPLGATVTAECTPVKTGRRLSVWQTSITNGDKQVALVTQTQLVL